MLLIWIGQIFIYIKLNKKNYEKLPCLILSIISLLGCPILLPSLLFWLVKLLSSYEVHNTGTQE